MLWSDDLRPEYNLSSLRVRKRGPGRTMPGDTTVALAPDVAAVFTSAAAVNEALRFLIKITKDNASDAILSPAPWTETGNRCPPDIVG